MNKWAVIFLLLILAVALGLRLPRLAERPMHHDEANQAYRFGMLLETGQYTYDADDHHGPSLYYLTLPIAWLTGVDDFAETDEHTYRLLPVIFGMLLMLCLPMLHRALGHTTLLAAALFTAVSPAMAYYSRFYIQEMALVFFTFVTLAAGWQVWSRGLRVWAVICGISAGLIFATKETAVLSYAAMCGAGVLCMLLNRRDASAATVESATGALRLRSNLLIAAGSAVLVAYVLFSSFFSNPGGPLESILAFRGYAARGTGVETDHVHPWYFYLRMLSVYRFDSGPVWSEGLIAGLGMVGATFILLKRIPSAVSNGLARFLVYYTLLLTLAYTVIPYKTPWCILSFLHGWILLAGIGVAAIFETARQSSIPRLQTGVILFLLLVPVLGTYRTARRTVFRFAADYRNPYVYAHTAPDFLNLIKRIGQLQEVSPYGSNMYIQVVADPKETWPLPFYLRSFPNTGFWTDPSAIPAEPQPDIIISSPEYEINPVGYQVEFYGLRADTLLAMHIRSELWDRFISIR